MAELGDQVTSGQYGIVWLDQGNGISDVFKIGLALQIWTGEKSRFRQGEPAGCGPNQTPSRNTATRG